MRASGDSVDLIITADYGVGVEVIVVAECAVSMDWMIGREETGPVETYDYVGSACCKNLMRVGLVKTY